MMQKALLYCTKAKNKYDRLVCDEHYGKSFYLYGAITENFESLNGKIVAECDYEVEEIKKVNYDCMIFTNTLDTEELINKSCTDYFELDEYLKPNWDKEDDLQNLDTVGKAIHIKNLNIFDKPRELSDCYKYNGETLTNNNGCLGIGTDWKSLTKAPQNMMRVWLYENGEWVMYILIPVSPEEMCRIANKEQTVLVRKRVLKEMLN